MHSVRCMGFIAQSKALKYGFIMIYIYIYIYICEYVIPHPRGVYHIYTHQALGLGEYKCDIHLVGVV